MPQDKKIIMLDASSLKTLACSLKFYRTVVQGYRHGASSIDMTYGTAFHMFISDMNTNGGNFAPAISKAVRYFEDTPSIAKKSKGWMTSQHLTKTCIDYWENYNGAGKKDVWKTVEVEGQHMSELKFATLPYYSDDTCDIILSGTIDDICKQDGGCYAIRDYKTTSSWDVDSYLSDYRLSNQLIFYVFVLYWYAKQYPDSIYAKIIAQGRVAAFIDGIFLKSGATVSVSGSTQFRRSEMFFFSEKDLLAFKALIDNIAIPRIVAMLKSPPLKEGILNGFCTSQVYGRCGFFGACSSPDDIAAEHILRNEFIQKDYNPLKFN